MPLTGGGGGKPPNGWEKADFEPAVQTALDRAEVAIDGAEKGAPNGVASNGPDGKVVRAQLPDVLLSALAVTLTNERPRGAEVCLFLDPTTDPGTNAVAGKDLWLGDVV